MAEKATLHLYSDPEDTFNFTCKNCGETISDSFLHITGWVKSEEDFILRVLCGVVFLPCTKPT